MAPVIGFIILGALAGLFFASIAALFKSFKPVLLAATIAGLGAFTWLSIDARSELEARRKTLAEYRPPAGQTGPDTKLEELRVGKAVTGVLLWVFAVSAVIALAGLVAQTIRLARRAAGRRIENRESRIENQAGSGS